MAKNPLYKRESIAQLKSYDHNQQFDLILPKSRTGSTQTSFKFTSLIKKSMDDSNNDLKEDADLAVQIDPNTSNKSAKYASTKENSSKKNSYFDKYKKNSFLYRSGSLRHLKKASNPNNIISDYLNRIVPINHARSNLITFLHQIPALIKKHGDFSKWILLVGLVFLFFSFVLY
jgi:hypothetical protein